MAKLFYLLLYVFCSSLQLTFQQRAMQVTQHHLAWPKMTLLQPAGGEHASEEFKVSTALVGLGNAYLIARAESSLDWDLKQKGQTFLFLQLCLNYRSSRGGKNMQQQQQKTNNKKRTICSLREVRNAELVTAVCLLATGGFCEIWSYSHLGVKTGTFTAKAVSSEERLTWNDDEGPIIDN